MIIRKQRLNGSSLVGPVGSLWVWLITAELKSTQRGFVGVSRKK